VLLNDTPAGRAQALWKTGYAAYRRQEMDAAKRLFLESMAADRNYAPPYNSLGNIESKAGRIEDAIGWYQKAKALSPGYAAVYFNLALADYKLEKLDEARASLREAVRLRPGYEGADALSKAIDTRAMSKAEPK